MVIQAIPQAPGDQGRIETYNLEEAILVWNGGDPPGRDRYLQPRGGHPRGNDGDPPGRDPPGGRGSPDDTDDSDDGVSSSGGSNPARRDERRNNLERRNKKKNLEIVLREAIEALNNALHTKSENIGSLKPQWRSARWQ